MACLALLSVIFIWSENDYRMIFDRIVWFLLFVDVIIRIIISKNKFQYILNNPFDIIAAIPLDAIFHSARLVRLFRIIRLISIGTKHSKTLKQILQTNGLNKVFSLSIIMLFSSSILVTHFEPSIDSYADGLWWSIVTTTTVGYGDISPQSIIGRLVAIFLMVVGIGLIGMFTSSLTTYFINGKEKNNPTIDFLKAELDRYDELNDSEKKRMVLLLEEMNKEPSPLDQKENETPSNAENTS
ncbi:MULTISPECIES: potassium channel family protein [Gracilibacillus]|uniref:potassium channel family protein n=1 Tax=Gracilibacillus TaxID=74385 RepID=UPI0021CBB6D7|nr:MULTISPECIES: potassium channel family protein [Gracilibacillus]